MPTPTATIYLPYSALDDVLLRGTRAAQPAATAVTPGTLYAVTDEGKVEQSTGAAWTVYGGAGSGALTPHHGTHEPGGTDAIAALDAGILTTGTLPDARLSANVARRDQGNTFDTTVGHEQVFQGPSYARILLKDPSQPADARQLQGYLGSQTLTVQFVNDAGTVAATPTPLALDRVGGHAHVGGDVYEKTRTTPIGHWINVPWSAGNFTAYPSGSWTVPSGAVVTLAYMLIGKTMWIQYLLFGTGVTGTPTELRMVLPAGQTVGYTTVNGMAYREPSPWAVGYCSPASGQTYVRFQKDPDSVGTWADTHVAVNTYIYGMVVVPLM